MVGSLLNNMNDPFARIETDQSLVDFTHFGGSKAFDTMGFADSDGASNGRAGTQEVDSNKLEKLELQRQKREERDKTNELIELGYQLRQSRTESITVGGISLSVNEWKNIKDTLDDPAKLALLKEQMRAQGKTEAEIDESIDVAKMASNIALKKHSGESEMVCPLSVDGRFSSCAVPRINAVGPTPVRSRSEISFLRILSMMRT